MSIRLDSIRCCMALLLALGLASATHASGTTSHRPIGPGAEFGLQTPPGGDSYERGRRVYLQRIACDACPLPGGAADAEAASALVARVENGDFDLRRRDARAVVVFLERRWRLR